MIFEHHDSDFFLCVLPLRVVLIIVYSVCMVPVHVMKIKNVKENYLVSIMKYLQYKKTSECVLSYFELFQEGTTGYDPCGSIPHP